MPIDDPHNLRLSTQSHLRYFPPEDLVGEISSQSIREALLQDPRRHAYQAQFLFQDYARVDIAIKKLDARAKEIEGLIRKMMSSSQLATGNLDINVLNRINAEIVSLTQRKKILVAERAKIFQRSETLKRIRQGHLRFANEKDLIGKRIPLRETYGEGYRATKRRAANALTRYIQYAIDYITHLALVAGRYLPGGIDGKTYRYLVNIVARLGLVFFRVAHWFFSVLDYTLILNEVADMLRDAQRWWNRETSKEIQQAVAEEFYKNIPVPQPVFEPKASKDYARALREYARVSKREVRDILINSSIAVAVGAGKKGLIRKSTRPTTTQLKQSARQYYTADSGDGHLRIQKILWAVSNQIGRDVGIEDKKEARRYVSRTKVKPLTRSRAIYYQAGFFQIAQALSRYQKGGRKRFEYKGGIKRTIGTAEVTPKIRVNPVVTMIHHGAWARQSAQLAIEEMLKKEAKGKMNQVKKRQQQQWQKMKIK